MPNMLLIICLYAMIKLQTVTMELVRVVSDSKVHTVQAEQDEQTKGRPCAVLAQQLFRNYSISCTCVSQFYYIFSNTLQTLTLL